MIIHINERYLLLPVSREAEEQKLHFYLDGEKIAEADMKLATDAPDFVFPMDMGSYIGRDIDVRIASGEETLLARIESSDTKPAISDARRPKIHFTAERGWINDPNGLLYADGVYHLFYQWNPYGTVWGNMHWGHAISRDLLTWEHRDTALYPDAYGPMFSGSGFLDTENVAGYGKDALLFFYTAAGGDNAWSKEAGMRYTQQLAVSTDGGETLQKKGVVLPHVKAGNRDPKVFYHAESDAYIMALYLDEGEFAIYRSEDMKRWTESSRLFAEGMWECPDLFRLTVSETGEKKWIFWSADGYYMIGEFDGYTFVPESGVLMAYDIKLGYAAQTYAGISNRVISVAWYRTKYDADGFRGMMSVPTELSLGETADGLRIRFAPVRELWDAYKPEPVEACGDTVTLPLKEEAAVYELQWNAVGTSQICVGSDTFSVSHDEKKTILILDAGIAEYFSKGGTVYGAVELAQG